MVETAEYGVLDDFALVGWFDLPVVRAVAAQPQVCAGRVVVVIEVL